MVPKFEMRKLYCLNCGKGVYELKDPIGFGQMALLHALG
jgi:hypothetical protein